MRTNIIKNNLIFFYISLVFFSVILRNKFGVIFSDEPFYIAMTDHFVQGAKPFIDEFMLMQMASVILYPVYKLYLSIFGTESIVLFTRILYLVLCAGFIIGLGFSTRKIIGYKFSLLIFLNLILFAVDNLFVPSYYTYLMLFLTTSLFLLERSYEKMSENKQSGLALLFFSGVTAALSMIVYPSMAPLAIVLCSIIIINFRTIHTIAVYLSGIFVGSIWFLAILLKDGSIHALINDFALIASLKNHHGAFGILRLKHIHYLFDHLFFTAFLILLLGAAYRYLYKKAFFKPMLFLIFSLLFYLVMAIVYLYPDGRTLSVLIVFVVLMGLMQRLLILNNQAAKNLFNFVFFPSICAGFLILSTSDTPYNTCIIGLFPAMAVSLIYWALWSRDMLKRSYLLFVTILLVMVNVNFIRIAWSYCYQDSAPRQLSYQVKNGPYAGLYTTEVNVKFLEDLQNDLAPYANRGYSLYSYFNLGGFAATYLISGFKIHTDSIWSIISWGTGGLNTLKYFQKNDFPDLVVKIKCIPSLGSECLNFESLMDQTVKKDYSVAVMNEYYVIYKKNISGYS